MARRPLTLRRSAEPALLNETPRYASIVSAWPMWVIGFLAMIDNLDQYIVRGAANQIQKVFGVGDFQIGILFSAFIIMNGIATIPAMYIGDRGSRRKLMAVTIAAWSVLSALGGVVPADAFLLLVVLRGALGFGQATTSPASASLLADYYGINRRGKAFSLQACLSYVGLGLGLVVGSFFATRFGHNGWRLAFLVSIVPGLILAYMCWRLPEPRRGSADRAYAQGGSSMEMSDQNEPLFPEGFSHFMSKMVRGLKNDMRIILHIPTMRYALVGVSNIFFVVTAVSTWMPTFYERQFGLSQGKANAAFGALAVVAGILGTLLGGMVSDRLVARVFGARVVIPGVCLGSCALLFLISFIPMRFAIAYSLELVGFFIAASSLPSLRAGLADAMPAQLRSTSSGAFNVTSLIFGSAAAPLITSAVATAFGGNYRVAFSIVMPIAFVGTFYLFRARAHIERDTAAVLAAAAAMAPESPAPEPSAPEPPAG